MPTVTPIVTIPTANYGFPGATNLPNIRPVELFSYVQGDIISLLAQPMSKLYRWIPSFSSNKMNRDVKHLSFLVPTGYTGEETYLEYITVEDPIGLCEFGSASVEYNICEYRQPAKRMTISNEDEPLHYFAGGGIHYCMESPRQIIVGPNPGLMIDNDRDWILSTLTWRLQEHLKWNLIHGTELVNTSMGSFDGLRRLLTVGYVAARKIGEGSCVWTDPLVVSGVSYDTAELLALKVRWMLRKIIHRMTSRGYTPTANDIVVVAPRAFLSKMWDKIAAGVFVVNSIVTGVDFQTTPEVWQRQRATLDNATDQYDGVFPVDGLNVPCIAEDNLGHNTTATDGSAAITGDVMILTRTYRGMNILFHEYLDLQATPGMPSGNNGTFFQNGMVRAGFVEVNQSCYWYWEELYGRMNTLMQPLQGRIVDVTLALEADEESIEAAEFYHQDFYAYEGAAFDTGTPILVGL